MIFYFHAGLVVSSYNNISDSNVTFTSLTYANGPGGPLKNVRNKNLIEAEVG